MWVTSVWKDHQVVCIDADVKMVFNMWPLFFYVSSGSILQESFPCWTPKSCGVNYDCAHGQGDS